MIQDLFYKEVMKKEEEIIVKILTMLLKREPVIEDAKELTKIKYPHLDPLDYDLAYKNITIGRVRHEFNGASFTITFTPDDRFI